MPDDRSFRRVDGLDRIRSNRAARIAWAISAGVGLAIIVLVSNDGLMEIAGAQTVKPKQTAAVPAMPSNVEETYDAWRVVCRQVTPKDAEGPPAAQRQCSVVQQQYDESSKQRVLAIEFQQPTPDKLDGVAVLPFGLALERGVTLQIDSTPLVVTARYRTCLPAGCLVPLSLDSKLIAAFRKGQTLVLTLDADDGKSLNLKVPLKGLVPAIDRAIALGR